MMRIIPGLVAAGLLAAGCAAAARKGEHTLKLTGRIGLPRVEGRIDHFAMDEKGGRLFMAALGSNAVVAIDVNGGKVIDRINALATPQGIAFADTTRRLAVANAGDGSCRLFDATTLKEVGRVDLKDDADNVRFDRASGRFWVGYGEGGLAAIDAAKGVKTAEIKLDGHPESFQLEAGGDRIFVNVPAAKHIAVIDRKQQRVIAKWPIQGAAANFPMALDDANHRLFVGCRRPAKLVVFDMRTGKEIAAVDCVGDTDDLFYDPADKMIYVCGGEGAVDAIEQVDADHYERVDRVQTAPGARTGFFASKLGKLFVAVPHRGAQEAQVRAFGVNGRK